MKIFKSLLLTCFLVFFCTVLYAQEVIPTIADSRLYTWTYLMGLSILGILVHWLIDLKKAQAQGVSFTMKHYMNSTWVSSVISLLICFTAVLLRHELAKYPTFASSEGALMALLGYSGDSILPWLFGFAKSKGLDIPQT